MTQERRYTIAHHNPVFCSRRLSLALCLISIAAVILLHGCSVPTGSETDMAAAGPAEHANLLFQAIGLSFGEPNAELRIPGQRRHLYAMAQKYSDGEKFERAITCLEEGRVEAATPREALAWLDALVVVHLKEKDKHATFEAAKENYEFAEHHATACDMTLGQLGMTMTRLLLRLGAYEEVLYFSEVLECQDAETTETDVAAEWARLAVNILRGAVEPRRHLKRIMELGEEANITKSEELAGFVGEIIVKLIEAHEIDHAYGIARVGLRYVPEDTPAEYLWHTFDTIFRKLNHGAPLPHEPPR